MIAATSHDVGHAQLGRRDRGSHLSTRGSGRWSRINALGVAPSGATAEFFKGKGMNGPARVRAAGRGDPGHAGRDHRDAGGVSGRCRWRTCSRRRSRWRKRVIPSRRRRRARIEREKRRIDARLAVLARGDAPAAPASAPESRRALRAARPGGDAAQARRSGTDARGRRPRPQGRALRRHTTASTRATSRRSSSAACASRARLVTAGDLAAWKVHVEEPVKTRLQGHRRLQAQHLAAGAGDAPGAEHPRRRST